MAKTSYEREMEKWRKERPTNGTYYDFEAWLEQKPDPNQHPDGTSRKKVKQ